MDAATEFMSFQDETQETLSSHVVISIDTSGSMNGPRLEQAKRGAITLVEALGAQDSFSILSFSSSVNVLQKHQEKQHRH